MASLKASTIAAGIFEESKSIRFAGRRQNFLFFLQAGDADGFVTVFLMEPSEVGIQATEIPPHRGG